MQKKIIDLIVILLRELGVCTHYHVKRSCWSHIEVGPWLTILTNLCASSTITITDMYLSSTYLSYRQRVFIILNRVKTFMCLSFPNVY